MDIDPRLGELLALAPSDTGRIVVMTAAGISAESGIPTFRGPEGYWRVGSVNYQPEQLATFAAFTAMPAAIWGWYLHRRGVCLSAVPNAAHRALVELEQAFGHRFLLVTQNVDGLHLRAGTSPERLYQVHGNLHHARCARGCSPPQALPAGLGIGWGKDRVPDDAATLALLHCGRCGGWLRPHVLWFDECYDEAHYHFDSALAAIDEAALLLVVGTSGATNLPDQMVRRACARRVPLVVVNLDDSPFSVMAQQSPVGWFAQGKATAFVPAIAAALIGH
ncbi:MAG TPA: Sir2 family NAD-dependent protein deacetylase [Planctomycetota bacterium]|nr:Sir2 family NAD-dependent protein deacetylase [Planctomycetota bacterium]